LDEEEEAELLDETRVEDEEDSEDEDSDEEEDIERMGKEENSKIAKYSVSQNQKPKTEASWLPPGVASVLFIINATLIEMGLVY
jgi:hypothetical protein